MKTPSNKELREFIFQCFNDSELDTFCFDYFLEVKSNFTDGMRKNNKVMDLIEYCSNRRLLENLRVSLQQERGEMYQQAFAPEQPLKQIAQRIVYTPQPRNRKKVFVIHSSKDTVLAQKIAADLLENGYEIFITPNSIQPGEKWGPAIDRGLDECGIFLTLLTPRAAESGWVQSETYSAISKANKNKARVFFLDIEQCKVPSSWSAYQYISFHGKNYKQDMQNVLHVLEGKKPLRKPITKPQPAPKPEKPVAKHKELPVNAERQQRGAFKKYWTLVFLGWFTFTVSIATLMNFIISGDITQYGSLQWITSLFFMFILLAVGFGLLYLGGDRPSLIIWGTLFGMAGIIISLALYIFLGYAQITESLSLSESIGAITLFLLAFSIGPLFFYNICSLVGLCHHLRWLSYIYGAVTLLLVLAMINKYFFMYWGEIMEVIILMAGVAIFLFLYRKSKR